MKDLKHLIYFESLLREANNELVKQAKDNGQLALGYTCYFVPEVLLNLPGCFSSRLRAPGCTAIDVATYYMSNKTCPFSRSILERAIEGGYNWMDALLSSETCSMMHRSHEYFEMLNLVKKENDKFFLTLLDAPFITSDVALEHYESQLRIKILEPLNKAYGIDISDKALKEAIDLHNEISEVITQIGDMRKLDNPPITGYEFHVIQLISQICPQKLILPKLSETLEELKTREPEPKPWFRARIVLTGGEVDDPAFTKLIEECGAMVVADRYCYGSIPGREQIDIKSGESALAAIARHYLTTSQCPRFMENNVERKEYIKKLTKEYKADGVIYDSVKFCEYWAYERVIGTIMMTNDYGIPCIGVEKDYSMASAGQLRTRIQAFIESIEIKNIQKKGGNIR